MKIPQVCPWLGEEERDAVASVVESTWITEGPKTEEFGAKLNELMGVDYGVFAPNGTLALYLALAALGIGRGDEVIVPDTTFIGSATAVVMTGATPVFVDVNRRNYQIELKGRDDIVTERTRALMPVHLYGMVANMEEVMDFAGRHGLKVVEDAAQAIGVRYRGRHAGTFGDVGCFSFFADKTITTGEGGYVVCRDEEVHKKLMLLRNQGRLERGSFVHPSIGYNFRITDMQAAVGLVQLKKLEEIIERKLKILKWYEERLKAVGEVRFLEIEPGSEYAPFRVVLLCKDREGLTEFLTDRGVQTRSFFYPLHKQPCFSHLAKGSGGDYELGDSRFPNAIYGYNHGICLPVFPTLSEENADYICSAIKEFYAK